jgi:hypothetical protein
MMIFVIYAAIVWWLAAKWRRTWRSFVVVTVGVLFILAIAKGHDRLAVFTGFRFVGVMVNALLYPYVILLGLMGYYIAVIPRPVGEGAHKPCRHCGYDLVGAEEFASTLCPECGADWRPIKPQSTELAAIPVGKQKLP